MQWLRLHTHPKLLAHQCGAHIRCMNHLIGSGRAYGTIDNPLSPPLVDPDFVSRLKAWVTAGLQTIPYHYAVVEAPYPSKAACTSMWSTYKVFEPLHMQWTGIWNHRQPVTTALVDPDFDSRLKAWVTGWATNHTIMQWLRLHTHPKLLAHQCGAHIRCLNHFICSGWAHGTIGNPLPPPLLTQI